MPNNHFIYSRSEISDELKKPEVKVGDFIIQQGNNQYDVVKYKVTTKDGKKSHEYFGSRSDSEILLPSSSSNSSKNKKRNRSTSGKSASGKSKSKGGKNASGKNKSTSGKNKTKKTKK